MQRLRPRKPNNVRQPIGARGQHPNHVWVIRFQFDETADGRPVKILNMTNEFTREALVTNPARRITAAGTMAVPDRVVNNGERHSVCEWITDQSSLPKL